MPDHAENRTHNPNTTDPETLVPAAAVIDRFGGIRPMAAKLGVPVTTVQGWKKRDVIPGNRRADILRAAQTHGVSLDGLFDGGEGGFRDVLNTIDPPVARPSSRPLTHEDMMNEITKAQKAAETRATRKAVLASGVLLGVCGMIFTMMVMIHKQQVARQAAIQSERLASIEDKIANMPMPDPAYAGVPRGVFDGVMNDVRQKVTELRRKTDSIGATVEDLKAQAQNVISLDESSLVDRVMALESTLAGLTGGNTDLSMVLNRVGQMQSSIQGQEKLEETVARLQSIVTAMQAGNGAPRPDGMIGPPTMEQMLAAEQQSGNSALAEALQGVSPAQLKAAAMLIGLSQFRETMRRSGPYAEDLVLLQSLLGDRDPELNDAIAMLAPYAETGVLSPRGLSDELKSLTGEIVVASITGQDVSVQDRAMARFQEVLKIQKDGQPVMGNDTQARIARAQSLLDSGDVSGAIAELEGLEGPARERAQPLIDQAQITEMAQHVQGLLTSNVMNQIKSGLGGVAGGSSAPYVVAPQMRLPEITLPSGD